MAAQRAQRIGARMRERRDELDLTQPQVADRIAVASVTKDYVSRWERGKIEPSEAYLDRIAEALETTVADLMAGPVSERKQQGPTPDLVETFEPKEADQLARLTAEVHELGVHVAQISRGIDLLHLSEIHFADRPVNKDGEQKPGRGRRTQQSIQEALVDLLRRAADALVESDSQLARELRGFATALTPGATRGEGADLPELPASLRPSGPAESPSSRDREPQERRRA